MSTVSHAIQGIQPGHPSLHWGPYRSIQPSKFSMSGPAGLWETIFLKGLGFEHKWGPGGSIFTSQYSIHCPFEGYISTTEEEKAEAEKNIFVPNRIVKGKMHVTLLIAWTLILDTDRIGQVYLLFRSSPHRQYELKELIGMSYMGDSPHGTQYASSLVRWLWSKGLQFPDTFKMELSPTDLFPDTVGEIISHTTPAYYRSVLLRGLGFLDREEPYTRNRDAQIRYSLNGPVQLIYRGFVHKEFHRKRVRISTDRLHINVYRMRADTPYDIILAIESCEWGETSLYDVLGISQGGAWDERCTPDMMNRQPEFVVGQWLRQNQVIMSR